MSLIEVSDLPPSVSVGRDDDDLEAAISWASSQVESYCERKFAQQTDHVVLVNPLSGRTAQLLDPPVTAVTLVEAWLPRQGAMEWVSLPNYAFTEEGLLYDTTGLPGVLYDGGYTWPTLPRSLRVTYTHGFAETPQPVKDAVIRAVSMYLTDPTGRLVQKQIDDVSYQWSANTSSVVDQVLLGDYRLVSVA